MLESRSSDNKMQMRNYNKDFLIFLIITSIIISSVIYYSFIQNNPVSSSDFPRINIVCEENLSNDEYVNCTFELVSNADTERVLPMKSKIKIRGSFNAKMKKKGYRLELSDQISLLGMRKNDD